MDDKSLLQSLELRNFLSYGPEGEKLDLLPLNVLIGPNGSGKSNFIHAINLLYSCASEEKTFVKSVEKNNLIWKGEPQNLGSESTFEIIATVKYPDDDYSLCHKLKIAPQRASNIFDESIRSAPNIGSNEKPINFFYCHKITNKYIILEHKVAWAGSLPDREERQLDSDKIDRSRSILGQFVDYIRFRELTFLANYYKGFYFFRNSLIGYQSFLRGPQDINLSADFLSEDGSNLSLVINNLMSRPAEKKNLQHALEKFYPYLEDIHTKIESGAIDTYFLEKGLLEATPSLRFSDGTLRFLCLLVILCHPKPPPLICIEDPEIGLHPDVFPLLAQLLEEAAEKTQIIVTTQSDELVSAFSHRPESVVVCERDDAGSHLRRLDREQLKDWLEKYSLGHLWRMGEIGGNL